MLFFFLKTSLKRIGKFASEIHLIVTKRHLFAHVTCSLIKDLFPQTQTPPPPIHLIIILIYLHQQMDLTNFSSSFFLKMGVRNFLFIDSAWLQAVVAGWLS